VIEKEPDLDRTVESVSTTHHLLTLVIGVLPVYSLAILMHLTKGRPYTLTEMMVFPLAIGGGCIVLIALLLRLLCREWLADLNLQAASLWRDMGHGLILTVILIALAFFEQFTLFRWLPSRSGGEFSSLIQGLLDSPLLLALWLGPVVWIGVAGFEELTRTLMLSRLWRVWPQQPARWFAIAASVVIFGLAHIYQGPAGVVSVGIMAGIKGVYYLRYGRVWPLIISHALYDSAWIAFALQMMSAEL
jgi:membrane protease YdiL (CAAX protease family)